MTVQNDNTILKKADLKAYHERIAPMLGGTFMSSTNVSDHYSTSEQIVGVWTDGKPVYQVTYVNATTQTGSFDVTIESNFTSNRNVEKIVKLLGTQCRTDALYCYGVTAPTTNDVVRVNNGTLMFHFSGTSAYWYVITTVQYTKTTDAAGSGVTTPGAYDINFPNTWPANTEIYFGNGLYGYRATGNFDATPVNTRWVRDFGISVNNNTKLYSIGGYTTYGGYADSPVIFGSDTWSNADHLFSSSLWVRQVSGSNYDVRLGVRTFNTTLTTSDKFDIWFTYTR